MNSQRLARILRRTPGEVAFDRCFFPLAAVFVAGVVTVAFTLIQSQTDKPRSEAEILSAPSDPAWYYWGPFIVGWVIAFLWFRAAISVAKGWRDPSARILRLSAVGLLVPLAWIALHLLLTPFFK